jgi:hypothetical protein
MPHRAKHISHEREQLQGCPGIGAMILQPEEHQAEVQAVEHGRQITNLRFSWGIGCASHYRDKQFPRLPLSPSARSLGKEN